MNSLPSSLTAALIAAAAVGTCFRTTRQLGVAACAGLCFLHPWLAPVLVIGLGALFLWRGIRP